jgi:alginate O-acetyltransferase complex protein AlgI
MNFASPFFLFAFLPICLVSYFLVGKKLRNVVLFAASLIFCIWSGPLFLPVAAGSALLNYFAGKQIENVGADSRKRSRILKTAIAFNILMLVFFKALVVYVPTGLTALQNLAGWQEQPLWMSYFRKLISLPTGISFYSFAAIAYLVDIYAARSKPANDLYSFSQYFFLFPKFTAGPIMRFREIANQLNDRIISSVNINNGFRRFIIGLGKKVLIADRLSLVVDRGIFDQAAPNLPAGTAWMIILFYSLQIYYDFSGYSDMAIGLGQMFGFTFPENFNYPYISRNISEFWRRWHMTLSGWFREYVFYPLERKRGATGGYPQYVNILIVFLLTGLWHGVTINFVIWGLLHGGAIAVETLWIGKKLKQIRAPLQVMYAMVLVTIGWVFFRSNTPSFAVAFLGNLIGISSGTGILPYSLLPVINNSTWLAFAAGILFAGPVYPWAVKTIQRWMPEGKLFGIPNGSGWMRDAVMAGILLVSIAVIAGSTFQPYIYGNF